ncbi:uncharacterized protein PITG_06445 [Phytophthora infestans T30-4]|uniref:DDE-1 domain-containing protein n=1 Tax=Phytophthora infestans (strain T30-4) TaxID=403677 RepID=D0N4W0_PHYIT|nr:uncharacterized protein PITG_06445 [Phytophthora infestans T30-4]EEY69918.1 conserved hypothetical protein [Phytophthora infestans T30-4]|eukprot:XP_002998565.1 conserved hypothetical protein [Phytophthora infestans T30-4]
MGKVILLRLKPYEPSFIPTFTFGLTSRLRPLSNVRVEKLPPNTTAKIQPLDQGIINSIKRYSLSQKMMFALDRLGEGLDNPYSVDQLTALLSCEAAWSKVSASTIQHCWNHSGLIQKSNLQFILT